MAHDAHILDFDASLRLGEYLRGAGIAAGRQPPGSPRSLLILGGLAEVEVTAVREAATAVGTVPCVVEDPLAPGRRRVLVPGERPGFAALAGARPLLERGISAELSGLLEADARREWAWRLRGRTLHPGRRTLVMGVVNVTPDSFSDGGRHLDPAAAIRHGLRLAGEGADLLDVGGESSRPGAEPVSAEVQCGRVLPVIETLGAEAGVPISVDTADAAVAGAAIEVGASAVNDITGLQGDPEMAGLVARTGAGVVLMHMQGSPATMQEAPRYRDVVSEVLGALREAVGRALAAGVARDRIALDPGLGFGKRRGHNLELLAHLGSLRALGRPILVGASRKRFVGELTGRPVGERLSGSLGAAAAAVMAGASVVRVHDVGETVDLVRTLDAVRGGGGR